MFDTADKVVYISCDNPDCCSGSGLVIDVREYEDVGSARKKILDAMRKEGWYFFKTSKKIGKYFKWGDYCYKCRLQGIKAHKKYLGVIRMQEKKKIKIAEMEEKQSTQKLSEEALEKGIVYTDDGINFVGNPNRMGYTIDSKRYTFNGAVMCKWVKEKKAEERSEHGESMETQEIQARIQSTCNKYKIRENIEKEISWES